jgi:FixJ family two-component response regulator
MCRRDSPVRRALPSRGTASALVRARREPVRPARRARGLSNAEIGRELYISDATVKTHITHILQKLYLRDRVQAVVLAHETALFDRDARPPADRT